MESKPTVLVVGATGAQGGSVARFLLDDGAFDVRCLSRNLQSDAARALQQKGAKLVQGDLSAPAGLRSALDGCAYVFGVTNFWEHFAAEREHGKNLIDAVKAAGVEHFVFSTLYSAKRISGGKLEVPHLDIKAELEDYTRALGIPTTFVHVAYYYENFLSFFVPQKQPDGSYVFGFPQGDTPLAATAVEDTGGIVLPIFKDPARFRDQTVGVVGDDRPPTEYAQIMSRVLGRTIRYQYVPREQFAALGFPGADDLANMFEFNRLYIPERRKDLELCRRLYPKMQDFETWAKANRARLEAVLK